MKHNVTLLALVLCVAQGRNAIAQSTYSRVGYFPVLSGPWYFSSPQQIAFDSSGNFYVSNESLPGSVIKYNSSGQFLRYLTGSRTASIPGMIPKGVAVGPDGTLYVVNSYAYRIEKFNAAGLFVGSIYLGLEFGNNQFPDYLAVDSSSRLYITSDSGAFVARYRGNGTFVDLIGNTPGDGQLVVAHQVALDATGNIYVADAGEGGRVMKYAASGQYLGKIGVGHGTYTVAVDSAGNVYTSGGVITKYDSTGSVLLTWGSYGRGPGQFNNDRALAVGPDGNIYVVDSSNLNSNRKIVVFTPNGQLVREYGSQGTDTGHFWEPSTIGIAPSGEIYVADTGNDRIQKFDRKGRFLLAWGSTGTGNGQFSRPWGVSVADNGDVFVTDSGNTRVQKFDKNGTFLLAWGTKGYSPGQFQVPRGISVNPPGNVIVVDEGYVQRFDENGNFLNRWITPTGTNQNYRYGVGTSPSGEVYTVNPVADKVEHYALDGTLLGSWGQTGGAPGQFVDPQGVCVDRSGFVYVADTSNLRIQKFDGTGGFIESIGPFANFPDAFSAPTGCGVSANGDLVVADKYRSRVTIYSRRPGAGRLVAAAASSPGQSGTYWRTDLTLSDVGTGGDAVEALFWSRGEDNTGASTQNVALTPGSSQTFPDVVASLFGTQLPAAGAIPISSSSLETLTSSRTWTPAATGGTYGQSIPAPIGTPMLFPGQLAHLVGLRSDASFRSNLGIVNLSDFPCRTRLDLYDVRGSPLGSWNYDLPPASPVQFGVSDLVAGDQVGVRAELSIDDLGCYSAAYASVIDNRTGDPLFVTARPPHGATADTDLLLPVVANAPGLNGSLWRSDIFLGNESGDPMAVSLTFFESGAETSTPPSCTVSLAGGESAFLEDIVGNRFGRTNAVGFVRISGDGYGLLTRSRTFNQATTGTFGQDVPTIEYGDLFSASRPARVIALRRDAQFRTNLGLVNPSSVTVHLTVTLYDGTGVAVGTPTAFELAPSNLRQVTDIAGTLGVSGDLPLFRATVTSDAAQPFFAYASVVDNTTGDAVFEVGQ